MPDTTNQDTLQDAGPSPEWTAAEDAVSKKIAEERKALRIPYDEMQMIRFRFMAAEKGPWLCDHWTWADVNDVSIWAGLVADENGDLRADSDKGSYIIAQIGSKEEGGCGLVDAVVQNHQAWLNGVFIANARRDMERLYDHIKYLEWRIDELEGEATPPASRVVNEIIENRENINA